MHTLRTPIAPLELQDQLAAGAHVTVVDVRSAAEFAAVHVKGSHHIPLPLLAEHAAEFAPLLTRNVVLVCQTGTRASEAKKCLAAIGFEGARVLAGGVPGYRAAGGQVVVGAQRWALERQVRLVAGSIIVLGLAGGRFVNPAFRIAAGVIGAGLTFSAATNTCAMGSALSAMPWNRVQHEPTKAIVLARLAAAQQA